MINKDLAYCRLALCQMIDQFMYQCMIDDKECFYNMCESAGEAAFSALGIEDDCITKQDFYKLYDKCEAEYREAFGLDKPCFSFEKFYLKELEEVGKTTFTFDDIYEEESK